MAVVTNPRQPVVYDMMLLAYALLELRRLEVLKVGRKNPLFSAKQTCLENACTKIRDLAQFAGAKKRADLINITDTEFGGTADGRFLKAHFDTISRYVSHLQEQRYKKESKYPRPTAQVVLQAGADILDHLKPVIDSVRSSLRGDAEFWYERFEEFYSQL
jgi:hypothetical protein